MKNNWVKKNHGGKKQESSKIQYAVFIGRWQPYHYGHIQMIEQKLDLGIPALILVRDIVPDEKNPFTTEQTIQMIEKYHHYKNHNVIVMAIPDIESVNFGRGVGYEVNEYFPPENIGNISATKIREDLKSGSDGWRESVDEIIQSDIVNYINGNK